MTALKTPPKAIALDSKTTATIRVTPGTGLSIYIAKGFFTFDQAISVEVARDFAAALLDQARHAEGLA